MPSEHPSPATFGRFLTGDLEPGESREVVAHLIAGCEHCAEVASAAWGDLAGGRRAPRTEPGDLTCQVERVLERLRGLQQPLDDERWAAAGLVDDLLRHPQARRVLLVRNSQRLRTAAVCKTLLERAAELGPSEPREALAVAELGSALAERLDPGRYGEAVVADFQARAWAVLGNARRIVSDLGGAEEALQRAVSRLEAGTGDPVEAAGVEARLGVLRHTQRRLPEALEAFGRALRAYRRVGDDRHVGRTLVDRARALGDAGESVAALEALDQALQLLDAETDPRWVLAARHNRVLLLHEEGRIGDALLELPVVRSMHEALDNRIDLLRLRWLEARLWIAAGRVEEAETALETVVAAFVEQQMVYPAALATLDLAALELERGRTFELRRRVAELVPVFRSLGIAREALAALLLLVRSVQQDTLTTTLLAETARRVERAAASR